MPLRAVHLQRGRVQDHLREQRRLPGPDLRVHGDDVRLRDDGLRSAGVARDTQPTNQAVMPDFRLYNNGTTPIPLSEMTLRYWFTRDTRRSRRRRWCDFATAWGARTSRCRWSPSARRAPTRTTTFRSASRQRRAISRRERTPATSRRRFSKDDFSNYNEVNDYSYSASTSFMVTTTRDRVPAGQPGLRHRAAVVREAGVSQRGGVPTPRAYLIGVGARPSRSRS